MKAAQSLAWAVLVSFALLAATPSANADDLQDIAEQAITAFLDAAQTRDADALDAVLEPEFQVQRSVGGGYDKAGYLAGGILQFGQFDLSEIVVT